jgi:hypothetical protein
MKKRLGRAVGEPGSGHMERDNMRPLTKKEIKMVKTGVTAAAHKLAKDPKAVAKMARIFLKGGSK